MISTDQYSGSLAKLKTQAYNKNIPYPKNMSVISSDPSSCTDMQVNMTFRHDGTPIAPQQRLISVSSQDSDGSDFSRDNSTDSFKLGESDERVHGTKSTRTVIIFVCGLCGLVVIICISMLVWMATSSQEKTQFCLPCNKVTLTSYEENAALEDVDRRIKNKKLMCCAKNDEMAALLLDYYVERKLKEKLARAGDLCQRTDAPINCSVSNSKHRPSAHILGTPDGLSQKTKTGSPPSVTFTINKWAVDSDMAFLNNIEYNYKSGRLVIPRDGLYYVYSQANFIKRYQPGSANTSKAAGVVSHSIHRFNIIYPNGGSEEMIKSRESNCWAKHKDYVVHTSYLGAVFSLRAQDELFIKVSMADIRDLSAEPKYTYFGLYLL